MAAKTLAIASETPCREGYEVVRSASVSAEGSGMFELPVYNLVEKTVQNLLVEFVQSFLTGYCIPESGVINKPAGCFPSSL
jgi:hypothetical protein